MQARHDSISEVRFTTINMPQVAIWLELSLLLGGIFVVKKAGVESKIHPISMEVSVVDIS
jgi:hypothetical protein